MEQFEANDALYEAINANSLEGVKRAIAAGADIDDGKGGYDKGKTPLMYAAWVVKNPDIIKFFVASGADVHARSCFGTVAFSYLATRVERGNVDDKVMWDNAELRKLLREDLYGLPSDLDGVELNEAEKLCAANRNLYWAIEKDSLDMVKQAITDGADVNDGKGEAKGVLPLMFAAWVTTRPEIIKFLVGSGADVHAKSCFGTVAFSYLDKNKALRDNSELRELLREDLYAALSDELPIKLAKSGSNIYWEPD